MRRLALATLLALATSAEVRINGPNARIRFDNETGEEVARLTASQGWVNASAVLGAYDVVVAATGDSLVALAAELREVRAQIADLQQTMSTLAPNLPPSTPPPATPSPPLMPPAPPPPPDFVVFVGHKSNVLITPPGSLARVLNTNADWGANAWSDALITSGTGSHRGVRFTAPYPSGFDAHLGLKHGTTTVGSSRTAITFAIKPTTNGPTGMGYHSVTDGHNGYPAWGNPIARNPSTDVFEIRVMSANQVTFVANGQVFQTINRPLTFPMHVTGNMVGGTTAAALFDQITWLSAQDAASW